MSSSLQVEIPPSSEPISLALTKQHLRVTTDLEDDLIGLYISAAREMVENYTSRSFVTKGFRQALDSFPYYIDAAQTTQAYPPAYASLPRYATTQWNYSQMLKLMVSPLVSVTSIEIVNTDGSISFLYPAPEPWYADTEYVLGDQIQDTHGNLQVVTAVTPGDDGTSSSGLTIPAWPSSGSMVGTTTTDGQLVWTKEGAAPAGDFVVDADSEPPRLFPLPGQTWPPVLFVPHAVKIHFFAGSGNSPTPPIPNVAKVAMLQAVGSFYENRETVTEASLKAIPAHWDDLLWSIRIIDLNPTPG